MIWFFWFLSQTFVLFSKLYNFFGWFIRVCSLNANVSEHPEELFIPTRLWRWNWQNVPERWHINFTRRWITQKKAYNMFLVIFNFSCERQLKQEAMRGFLAKQYEYTRDPIFVTHHPDVFLEHDIFGR
jgi:hypothetical protein